jgi:HAD superfamily hydrolase (TIGR01450 family)
MKRPGPHKSFLIDVEGVLVRDKAYRAIPGAVDWLASVQGRGVPFCLVSNNTTMPPWEQLAALREAGFDLEEDQQVGALAEGVRWLRERGRRSILWLGVPEMEGFWQGEGFETNDLESCQAVVLGANPGLASDRLAVAMGPLLDRGADLICLHRNRYFLDAEGTRRLGPGAWAAALEALGGSGKVVTVGKPAERIYDEGLKRVGTAPSDTLFISDDPLADLVTAGRLGMRTAFVLSGKHADHGVLSELEETDWPDVICAGLSDIDIPEVETP